MPGCSSFAYPFVFLHGFLGSPTDWGPLRSFLPPHQSIALMLPGHGDCPLPAKRPLLPVVIDAIIEAIEAKLTCSEKYTLVGYSLGGRLALHLALRYSKQIDKLILIAANPGLDTKKEQRLARDQAWADLLSRKGIDHFITTWYQQPLFRHFSLTPERAALRKKHASASLQRMLRDLSPAVIPSLWPMVKKISIPTLFLFGKEDQKYANIANRLNSLKSSIKTVAIQGAGHVVHLEKPQLTAAAIETFCNPG
ncbi:MAG: 2-succinyl-6-hydroxy-2,4-cyclohexadiene-1-carboxylate synthase [Chlamydiota bacterium]